MSRKSRSIGFVILSLAALCVGAGDAFGQARSWVDPISGGWGDSCRWSIPSPGCDPSSVPNTAAESASIGLPGAYTVTVGSQPYNLSWLNVAGPGMTVNLIYGGQLHLFGPSLANEGQILFDVCPGGSCSQPNLLDFQGNTTISGTGRIDGGTNGGMMTSAAGASVVHSAGHTILGKMTISAAMENLGYIVAPTAGRDVVLNTYNMTNAGVISALHAAEVRISSITVNNQGGMITADSNGRVEVTAGAATPFRINGGTYQTTPGSLIWMNGTTFTQGYLDGVHNLADCEVSGGVRVAGSGVFTNDGTVTVGAGTGTSHSLLYFQDSSLLAGSGQIVLKDPTDRARIDTAAGYTLLHPSMHTIRGYGRIDAVMTNDGLVSADVNNSQLELYTSPKTNNAYMQAVGGGKLDIHVPLTQSPGGELLASGSAPSQSLVRIYGTGSVTGGTLVSQVGAKIQSIGGTIADLTNNSTFELAGSGVMSFLAGSGIVNNATINMQGNPLKAISNVTVSGPGAIVMGAGCDLRTDPGLTLTNESGHTIRGTGTVSASLANRGALLSNVTGLGMLLLTNPKTNDGVCKATNTGYMNVNVDVGGAGDWIADGGTLRLAATNVDLLTTGDISLLNGGKFYSYSDQSTNVTTTTAANFSMDPTSAIDIKGVNPAVTLSADLDFAMTDDSTATWYWDSDATLTMTGGVGGDCQAANWAKVEVGGQDKGAPVAGGGYSSNFDLAKVTLGAGAHVALVDIRNNANRIGGVPEAMYCDLLTLNAGAVLKLNGYRCYVNGAQVLPGPRGSGMVVNTLLCNSVPGDMNCDAAVTLDDVPGFVQGLLDPIGFRNANPACELGNADLNGDGAVNGLDAQGFVQAHMNP